MISKKKVRWISEKINMVFEKSRKIVTAAAGKLRERTWKKWPIAVKVTFWYTFFISLIFAVLILVSVLMAKEFISDRSQSELIEKTVKMADKMDEFEPYDDGIYFSVIEGHGPEGGNYQGNSRGHMMKESKNHVSHVTLHHQNYMYYDVPLGNGKWLRGILPVSTDMKDIKVLIAALCLVSPFIIVFLALGGYRIMKKAFRPVQVMTETAEAIEKSGDFSKRLYVGDTKDEISDMAVVLNRMLASLEVHFMKEKQFSNDVSHELRTPVSVILAESEYGMSYSENDDDRESFAVIVRQSKRMKNMIQSILELSRLGRVENFQKEDVDLSALLVQMSNDYEQLCHEKGISLVKNIQPGIHVEANPVLCERLIDNLMSNALKFTKDLIEIGLEEENGKTVFSMADNGQGMNEEEKEKIWDRFYQADQSRNKKTNSGLGLGLSFVWEIAHQNGWKPDVETEAGKGSCFKICMDEFKKH